MCVALELSGECSVIRASWNSVYKIHNIAENRCVYLQHKT